MTPKTDQISSKDPLRGYADAVCHGKQDKWTIVQNVGNGNSASVYQVSINGLHAALKVYDPKFFQGDNREVERRRVVDQMSLKGHGHPNLIDFIEAGPVLDTFYLLMEYYPWQSLDKCLKLVDRSEISVIVSKTASAAEFLEERGFVHRDIKPANILVSETSKDVKLLDLGVMRPIAATDEHNGTDHGYALPFVATAQYSSPGYLFRESSATEAMWQALTFYQLGAVLHDLIMGEPIFAKEIRSQNRYRVAAAVLLTTPEVRAIDIPPRLITLARHCLLKEDNARLKRVSWSSFRGTDEFTSDQVRMNLGLGALRAPTQISLADNRKQAERLQIRITEAQDNLVDLAQHVFQANGFPQATTKKFEASCSSTRFVALAFRPSNANRVETNLAMILRLSVLGEVPYNCDVVLGAFLSSEENSAYKFDEGEFLWSSTLDDLKLEEEDIVSVLGDAFVRHYAMADQQLPRFEDASLQLNMMAVEVSDDG